MKYAELLHPEAPLNILCAIGFCMISQAVESQPWDDAI